MTTTLMIFPILLPLIIGALQILVRGAVVIKHQQRFIQRFINLIGFSAILILAVYLFWQVKDGERFVYLASNWIAPFGIVYVLDSLSAMMILISALLALAVLIYSLQTDADKLGENYHPFLAFQFFGINGAFLTGDVFNLFVFFEILLLASYMLLVHGGGKERTRAGLHFVVINLIGSALFLIAVSTIYGVVGTLNIADLALKVGDIPVSSYGVLASAAILLVIVFGIKSAMFPLCFWLPQAYPRTIAPVAALFAIMTKVGIYTIIRIHGTIFADGAGIFSFIHSKLILTMGLITAIVAALGVICTRSLRVQVAYLVLASVATLLIGVGITSALALSASLYYLIHSTFIVAGAFLWVDIIFRLRGGIDEHGDQIQSSPKFKYIVFVGIVFMLLAMSISGMPPFSGFLGKTQLLIAAFNHLSNFWAMSVTTIIIVSGLIIIIALARSGSIIFYKTQNDMPILNCEGFSKKLFIVPILLMSVSLLLTLFANPVSKFTAQAAKQQFDFQSYIQAVLQTKAKPSPHTNGETPKF